MALTTVRPQGIGFNTGRRNMVINGAMQVAQRGTSTASVTGGNLYAACDRWSNSGSSYGTFTLSQSTEAPAGFANSFKYDCTTANGSLSASSHLGLVQKFEGQNLQMLEKGTSTAKSVTVSFWVKSNKTGDYTLEVDDRDNTRSFSKKYTIDSADTWEFKSLTFAGDTTGTLDNDNANSFNVSWWLANGSDWTSGTFTTGWEARTTANRATPNQVNLADSTSNEWYMTGVQLELGENASDFEHRSFGEELELCKRYYQQIGSGYGKASSTSAFDCSVTFNPPMRANPTVSDNGTVIQITNITSADHNQSSVGCSDTDTGVTDGTYGGGRVRFSNFSGLTGGTTYAIDHNGSQGGAAAFDAEL